MELTAYEYDHEAIMQDFESNGKSLELDDLDHLAIKTRRKKFINSLESGISSDLQNREDLSFQEDLTQARNLLQTMRPLPNKQSCVFCRKNNEEHRTYSTHLIKNSKGEVTCPILMKYRCPYCGATGRHAHTIKYCPKYDGISTVDCLLRTPRNGFGKRKF